MGFHKPLTKGADRFTSHDPREAKLDAQREVRTFLEGSLGRWCAFFLTERTSRKDDGK